MQAALFSPAKYGILPEILPHEQLSTGNGLLEMWTNLAIIGGTVAGGVIMSRWPGGRPWLGGARAFGPLGGRPGRRAGRSRVPVARSEGGLVETLRIGWEAIRADRILRLAIGGQIFVWTIASLVPAPWSVLRLDGCSGLEDWKTGFPLAALGIGIGIGSVAAGRLSASKVEYGLLPLGALGLTLSHAGLRPRWARASRGRSRSWR